MLQDTEIFTTLNSNYLLIHKNGCSQVKKHLYLNYSQVEKFFNSFPQNNKINWTVLRDPYDRFISGLTYDLLKQFKNLNNLEKIIDNSLFLIYQKINLKTRENGNISHTIPQWTYLLSHPLDFLVMINNLDDFLDIHFQKRFNYTKTNTPSEQKDIVLNYIEKNSYLKNLIMAYLAPDYYYIQQSQFQDLFWTWQNGKIF